MDVFFYAVIGFIALYEAVALLTSRPGDTISEHVWTWSRRPLVPFLFGLVCGHWFWQR